VKRDNIEVLCVGGRVRAQTLGVVDHWAVSMLKTIVLDLAFMGANGVTLEHGMTVPDSAIAAVKIAALECTRRRIFVADSSKFGSDSFVKFADVTDFERVVTDSALPDRSGCNAPVSLRDPTAAVADVENLKAALEPVKVEGAFISAASPGVVSLFFHNGHYPGPEAYLEAIAEAPSRWPKYLAGTRRYVFPRFPFSFVYFQDQNDVFIVALAPESKRPGYWRERLR